MSESTLSISFSNTSTTESSCLKIEQEPWGQDVGETTQMQALQGIVAASTGVSWPSLRCGGAEDQFEAAVWVYPCRSDLSFNFRVSHGIVLGSMAEVAYREEIVNPSLQLEASLDYVARSIGRVSWIGSCYTPDGTVTGYPSVSIDGSVVTFSAPVFGSLRVRYTVLRHVYAVRVTKRLQSIENNYSSVAYAFWDGGVEWCDIEAPANFEITNGLCGNGGIIIPGDNGDGDGTVIIDPDDPDPDPEDLPTARGEDREIVYDYCSQELKSDSAGILDE